MLRGNVCFSKQIFCLVNLLWLVTGMKYDLKRLRKFTVMSKFEAWAVNGDTTAEGIEG